MHPFIARHQGEIIRICKRHQVLRLDVFGSAARGTDFDESRSDADFLVEFEATAERRLDDYLGLKEELEALLRRDVDLVEAGALRNPYLRAHIDSAREVLYAA
jgi:predicted nucleotidyltransferase